jgi:hypothetical protein
MFLAIWIVSCVMGGTASAQPQISASSTVVDSGNAVTITVTGAPGHTFALIGSSVGAGFSHAGIPLAVGADVTILTMGTLDGTGQPPSA